MEENEILKKAIDNLKEYIDEDKVYQEYKKNKESRYSDFEHFCISHCKDIEKLVNHYEKVLEIKGLPKLRPFTKEELNKQYNEKVIDLEFLFEYIEMRDKVYNLLIERNNILEYRLSKLDDEIL